MRVVGTKAAWRAPLLVPQITCLGHVAHLQFFLQGGYLVSARCSLPGVVSLAEDSMPTPPTHSPLAGLVVADLTRVLAGPYATQMLGDLGADVIKVESPTGDETRHWIPPEKDGVSTYYLGINRNKRSIVLDFRDATDVELARKLCRIADVVIHNHKPGSLAQFGLDYESVASQNPSVIYTSISGYGDAEGADQLGYDLTVQAASGLMSLTGDPDSPGFRTGMSVTDITTGLNAVIGILAALHHRDTTGDGQEVHVNLMMSTLSALANHSSTFLTTGVVPSRMGNAHPSIFPYEPFPTKDGELVIAAANNGQFRKLCEVVGLTGLSDDERFASPEGRNRHREALWPLLVDALRKQTAGEWSTRLSAVGVPCSPVNTLAEGFELANRLGLNPTVVLGDEQNTVHMVRHPIDFSATTPSYRKPPPRLGEHSAELRQWLEEAPDN